MSDPLHERIALLFAGGLLSILGAVAVEAIRRRRDNALGRTAMLSELRELGNILALAAYGVHLHQGSLTREFLEWLKLDLESHANDSLVQDHIPKLRAMLAFSDAQLDEMNRHGAGGPEKGTMLQHYSAPLLDARVAALWSFDTSFQRQLLGIKQRLSLLDDLVDRSRKYFDLTFTKLEGKNDRLVRENFVDACTLYAQSARRIVDLVRQLPRP